MNTLYAVSLIFGILAVLLSGMHGVGEVLQSGSPAGVVIDAWGSEPFSGAACEIGTGFFGTSANCLPAMTIFTFLPFQVVGILTIIFSLVLGMIVVQTQFVLEMIIIHLQMRTAVKVMTSGMKMKAMREMKSMTNWT